MMERLLILIKHRFKFLWKVIEWGNGLLFYLVYKSELEHSLSGVLSENSGFEYTCRQLTISDADSLYLLVNSQLANDLDYFSPHGFDMDSILGQFKNRAFLMMGVFGKDGMVGYFFLRFFANKKCFVGRLIDRKHRGRGIGHEMNRIMYETAWNMKFRCLSTISKNNKAVMGAHAKNQALIVLKELKNDYLLVEFVRETI